MATGDDLSIPADGRRLKRNEDLLPEGEYVWIRHPETGIVHKLNHRVHIRRLLDLGGGRVSGPDTGESVQDDTEAGLRAEIARLRAQVAQQHEGTGDASSIIDGTIDHARPSADFRPESAAKRGEPAISRSGRAGHAG